jgi:hypothetical protein
MLRDCLCPFNITYIPDLPGVTKGRNPGSEEGALVGIQALNEMKEEEDNFKRFVTIF